MRADLYASPAANGSLPGGSDPNLAEGKPMSEPAKNQSIDLTAGMRPWFVQWVRGHLNVVSAMPFDLVEGAKNLPPPLYLTPTEEAFYRTFCQCILERHTYERVPRGTQTAINPDLPVEPIYVFGLAEELMALLAQARVLVHPDHESRGAAQ
jgi:hypothetical protein